MFRICTLWPSDFLNCFSFRDAVLIERVDPDGIASAPDEHADPYFVFKAHNAVVKLIRALSPEDVIPCCSLCVHPHFKVEIAGSLCHKSTDGYWYDKAGTQYNQITDYEFVASNGASLSLYKPQVQNNNVPDGDPFTVYWENGNTTTLTHYTDGYFYSSDWVRYTLSGSGTYSGADGTVLYAHDPWTQQPSGSYYGENEEGGEENKSVQAAEAGYVTIYDSAGNSVTVYLAEDAYWYDKAGNQYIQMGNGTFETPGGTVYYY